MIVEINEQGSLLYNGQQQSLGQVESLLRQRIQGLENSSDITLTIAAQKDVPFDDVVELIQLAGRLKVKAILATKAKES